MAVNGALDGVERVLFAHLSPGDRVAIEDPGFAGLIDLVRSIGLIPVPVAVDAFGVVPNALGAVLGAGVAAVVLTPRGHNPTGAAFDAARARDVRRVLGRFESALVVEDDHLGPIAGTAVFSVVAGREHWAVVRSASKWLAPDLRVAVLAGDERTVRRVAGRQAVGPGWVSTLTQRIAAALWSDSEVLALADQAATVYGGRRRALVEALAAHGHRGAGAVGAEPVGPGRRRGRRDALAARCRLRGVRGRPSPAAERSGRAGHNRQYEPGRGSGRRRGARGGDHARARPHPRGVAQAASGAGVASASSGLSLRRAPSSLRRLRISSVRRR